MKKDTTASVRINSDIKKRLEKDGYSVQQLLDMAIAMLYPVGGNKPTKKRK